MLSTLTFVTATLDGLALAAVVSDAITGDDVLAVLGAVTWALALCVLVLADFIRAVHHRHHDSEEPTQPHRSHPPAAVSPDTDDRPAHTVALR